jgi:hypothetical protein
MQPTSVFCRDLLLPICKRWRGLLADPTFLRLVLQEPEDAAGRSSAAFPPPVPRQRWRPLVAWWGRIATLFRNRAPAFVSAPGSALGPRRRFLTSFVRGGGAGLLEDAEPLAERGGLVLLQLFFPGRKPLSLCVCSLLTGKLDVLPCFHGGTVRGYAVLPSPSTDHGGTPQRPADGYSNLCTRCSWSAFILAAINSTFIASPRQLMLLHFRIGAPRPSMASLDHRTQAQCGTDPHMM